MHILHVKSLSLKCVLNGPSLFLWYCECSYINMVLVCHFGVHVNFQVSHSRGTMVKEVRVAPENQCLLLGICKIMKNVISDQDQIICLKRDLIQIRSFNLK